MPRLEVRDVAMQFPAVRALDGVSLAFEPGEVHGIIGENGAGKSTLMRILAGLQAQTSGDVLHEEAEVTLHSVRDALALGIAMIHQELNLVDDLTVAENIFLGREPRRFGVLDRRRMNARAAEYLAQAHANISPDTRLGDLSLAQRQLVEIAKALSYEASILIMDEPTAVLGEQDSANLFGLIRSLKERGVTVLYISHRLAEVEQICDRISVLRDGRLVRTLRMGEASQAELASLMVGRDIGEVFPDRLADPDAPPALSVRDLGDGARVFGASFDVRPGEIVGFAGLIGSGRTELAETLIGIRRAATGSVERDGVPCRIRSPRAAARLGIAYVSEDRKEAGLVLEMDTVENTTLANLDAYARPTLRKRDEEAAAKRWVEKLDIRVGDLRAPVLFLSGGNQQKVSVAKWLETGPKVLILDEPTRGVDVGAKRELYLLIRSLAEQGLACLVISSEMQELIGLCHRVLVMRSGRIVGELQGKAATEDAIMALAAGVEAA
jgi:ribose transport system ATP-binding protein